MNKKTITGLISLICLLACVSISLVIMLVMNGKTEEVKMSDIEWYDENATEFTITTVKELYEVVELSNFYTFEGQTIKLGADIVVNKGNATEWNEKSPDKTWYPIKKFAGTFDGQGHTISGLYGVGIDVAMGMFSGSSAKAVVKDFKLTNSYFETKGNVGVGSIVVDGGGTFSQIYSDAIIDCDGNNASGIASVMKYKTAISECWYDGKITLTGRSAAGIVDQVNTVTIAVDHCLYTGNIYSSFNNGGARIGGLIGSLKGSGSNVTMTDSLSVGTVGAMQTSYLASVLGTAYASSSITIADTFGSMGTHAQAIGSSGNKGKFTGTPIEIAEKSLQGNEAYRWTSLDFEKYWTVVEDSTPILRCFADAVVDTSGLEKAYDISWYDEAGSEYTITTKEQLYGFYYLGTGKDFKGKTIKLGADIVLNEGEASDWGKTEPDNVWYPICRNSIFAGTFDGQGHTISGMYATGNTIGLFGKSSVKSTIKNLKVTNSYFKGEYQISSIVGQGCGTFDTIYSDAVLVAEANEKTTNANGGRECGGMIGQMSDDSKITNCWFAGTIETDTYAGGLVGNCANVSFVVDNCLFSGVIKGRRDEARNNIGGLIGHVNGSIDTIETMDVTNCLSAGRIINQDKATRIGSFIGYINAYRTYNFKNAYATHECYSQRGIAPFAGLIGSQKLVGVQLQAESAYVGYGGCQVTLLDFDKYWVAKSKTTPELKSFSTGAKLNLSGVAKADISWYNESKNTYILSDIGDLLGFTLLANNTDFAGKRIKLAADVALNSGSSSEWASASPAMMWTPVGQSRPFAGSFDGQGHVVSGLYTKGNAVGLFGKTTPDSKISNVQLANSYFVGEYQVGGIVGQGSGVFDSIYVQQDVHLAVVGEEASTNKNGGRECGGIVGQLNDNGQFTNCWFAGTIEADTYAGGMIGNLPKASLKMSNCLFSGTITGRKNGKNDHIGGFIGHVGGTEDTKETLVLQDCLSSGEILGEAQATRVGSVIGYINAYRTYELTNVYATNECYKQQDKVAFAGVAGKKKISTAQLQDRDRLIGVGGYRLTVLDFEHYWSVKTATTPELKKFSSADVADLSKEIRIDIAWYTSGNYTLSDVGDLYGLAYLVNGGETFSGKTITLANDIDVNEGWVAGPSAPEREWTPIGNATTKVAFAGTLDGNGKKISGIYVDGGSSDYVALFAYTDDAKIQNLRLTNSYIASTGKGIGSIIAYANGSTTLENVYSEATLSVSGKVIGGLIAQVQNGTKDTTFIKNSCYAGTITHSNLVASTAMGGLVGTATHGTLQVQNGLFVGTMDCIYKGTETALTAHVGGIIGNTQGSNVLKITNTLGAGVLDLNGSTITMNGTGSVAGYLNSSTYTNVINVDNVYGISSFHSKVLGGYVAKKNGLEQRSQNTEETVDGAKDTILEKLNGTQENTYWVINGSPEEDRYTVLLDSFKDMFAYSEYVPSDDDSDDDDSGDDENLPYDISWLDDTVNNGSSAETPYVLSDTKDLLGFAYLVNRSEEPMNFAGKFIQLSANIDVNPGWTAGATAPTTIWAPIGNATTKFAGTFDGNGKTISGIYVDGGATQYVGFFAYTDNATIKNLRLENSYITSTANGVGSIIAYANGSTTMENVYSNALLSVSAKVIGGLIAQVQGATGTTSTIKNSCYAGKIIHSSIVDKTAMGGFVGTATHGTLVIQNGLFAGEMECTYTGKATALTAHIGGMVGNTQGKNVVNITNSLGAGVLTVKATTVPTMNATGAILGYINSSTKTNVVSTSSVYGTETFHDKPVGGYKSGAGLTQRAGTDKTVASIAASADTILTALNSGLDKAYWVKNVNALEDRYTVVLKEFENIFNGTEWLTKTAGTEEEPYVLSNPLDLYGLAYLVNRSEEPMNFAGKFIQLSADIDVNPNWTVGATAPANIWTPIGNATTKFAGTFDGNGKTISGIYVDGGTTQYVGFFAYTDNATIKNLRFVNSYITSTAQGVGGVIAYANGSTTMENVYCDATLVVSNKVIGGLIALVQNANSDTSTIKNSCYAGSITHSNLMASTAMGGIVGSATNGRLDIQNGLFVGKINCTYSGTATSIDARVGGFCGVTQGTNVINVTNSMSAGVLTVTGNTVTMNGTGSVLGYMNAKTSTGVVSKTSVVAVSTFHSKPVGAIRSNYALAERLTASVNSVSTNADDILTTLNNGQEKTYWVKNTQTSEDRHAVVLSDFQTYFVKSDSGANQIANLSFMRIVRNGFQMLVNMFS